MLMGSKGLSLCYLGHINVVGVMLGRRDHQCDAFV